MNLPLTKVFERATASEKFKQLLDKQEVKSINVNIKEREIIVNLNSAQAIDENSIYKFEEEVKKAYQLNKFKVNFLDLKPNFGINYVKSILIRISEENLVLKIWLSNVKIEIEDYNVCLRLHEISREIMEKHEVANKIKEIAKEEIKVEIKVNFVYFAMPQANNPKPEVAHKNTIVRQNMQYKSPEEQIETFKPRQRKRKYLKKISNNKITKIIDVKEIGINYTISGEVFHIEKKEIKNDTVILIFCVTDNTYSITCKCFPSKNDEVIKTLVSGAQIKVTGETKIDTFSKELNLLVEAIEIVKTTKTKTRTEQYEGNKRIELHAHTKMSAMDGITDVEKMVKRAKEFGQKAVAITDHGSAQAFPAAFSAGKKHDVKIIYGVESYLVNNTSNLNDFEIKENHSYVVFDLETTGLSNKRDSLTEIGAAKVINGEIVDTFNCLINPERNIPKNIVEITGITNEMVKNEPTVHEALPRFLEFCKDSTLVAHNANFDMGFLRENAKKISCEVNNNVIDTLQMARILLDKLKKHKLNIVADYLGIELENHHRACDDAICTAKVFIKLSEILKKKS